MRFRVAEFFIPGVLFLLIFLSGYWLRRMGKPHGMFMITLHKFIGLGLGAYLIMTVFRRHQGLPLSSIDITAVAVTVLLFAVNVATGSLLSAEKEMPGWISWINKLFPYLTILSTGISIYLIAS